MLIRIGKYGFAGPSPSAEYLRNLSGVYAVLSRNPLGDKYTVLDIGESKAVQERIVHHDRILEWAITNRGVIEYAAYYCDERTRMQIESELRAQYNPACGVR